MIEGCSYIVNSETHYIQTRYRRLADQGQEPKMNSLVITTKEYRIGRSKVVDPVVHYEDRHLVCHNLPVSLTKLIPAGWGNAPISAWGAFIERAVILGML